MEDVTKGQREIGIEKVRLLVIDEAKDYFCEIRDWADMCSHQFKLDCKHAQSGPSASELIERWHPSVILLDLHLPDVSSLEILSACCARAIPVVVTSEMGQVDVAEQILEKGAFAYLPKNMDCDEMEGVLSLLVSAARALENPI